MKSFLAAWNRRLQAQTGQGVCRVHPLPLVLVPFSNWFPLAIKQAPAF